MLLEKAFSLLFEEHQLEALCLQRKPTLAEAEEQRKKLDISIKLK